MRPETFASAGHLPLRETIARALYDERPYTIAESGGVMEPLRAGRVLAWADAPDWYRNECYDFADGIAGRLLLAAAARRAPERQAVSHESLRAELTRRMAPRGSSKRIAFECGVTQLALYAMRAGTQRINERVAEWLGYRLVTEFVPCADLGEAVLDGSFEALAAIGEPPLPMFGVVG